MEHPDMTLMEAMTLTEFIAVCDREGCTDVEYLAAERLRVLQEAMKDMLATILVCTDNDYIYGMDRIYHLAELENLIW